MYDILIIFSPVSLSTLFSPSLFFIRVWRTLDRLSASLSSPGLPNSTLYTPKLILQVPNIIWLSVSLVSWIGIVLFCTVISICPIACTCTFHESCCMRHAACLKTPWPSRPGFESFLWVFWFSPSFVINKYSTNSQLYHIDYMCAIKMTIFLCFFRVIYNSV